MRSFLVMGLLAAGCMAGAQSAVAIDDAATGVRVANLTVKQRIESMEQINVTAEKPVDEAAPEASLEVMDLLAELEALEVEAATPAR